jgi:hypothetical protein
MFPALRSVNVASESSQDCAVWISGTMLSKPMLYSTSKFVGDAKPLGKWNMSRIKKLRPRLRKSPQPPLSRAGATADADRAKRPPLDQPSAPDSELNPGDRVEGLANFGKPTGEFGTVEKTNEDDALVKWDDDGRTRLHQPWLKKVNEKAHPFAKPASA